MGENSLIEWCHHSLNFWWGCTKVSAACRFCYAEAISRLYSHGRASWGPDGLRWIRTAAAIAELQKLNHKAAKRRAAERVFINSMSDTFEDRTDLDAPRAALFEAVKRAPHLVFLLLTKRPENIRRMVPAAWLEAGGWPRNVWPGATAENQQCADHRIAELKQIPAPVRWLSVEPMLEGLDLWPHLSTGGIHWVICGGESGPAARPIHPVWARTLREQCNAAEVAFFFKQWGEFAPGEHRLSQADRQFEDGQLMRRVGKKAAGRLLDGQEWSQFPAAA